MAKHSALVLLSDQEYNEIRYLITSVDIRNIGWLEPDLYMNVTSLMIF
jgi:hypothetical protein